MMTEDKALEILAELIKKPEAQAADIPAIWNEIMKIHQQNFSPVVEEPKKKKRRRGPVNPNIGWPAGVSRDEYKTWKAGEESRGVSENLNPQEYKRQRDAGMLKPATPESAPAAKAKPGRKAKTA